MERRRIRVRALCGGCCRIVTCQMSVSARNRKSDKEVRTHIVMSKDQSPVDSASGSIIPI